MPRSKIHKSRKINSHEVPVGMDVLRKIKKFRRNEQQRM